ncbi:MAG: M15 family metallopeptidase [Ferruginibacter sp.]|nr:M15 family metallopeptidase [Ferruginibacter sp.]
MILKVKFIFLIICFFKINVHAQPTVIATPSQYDSSVKASAKNEFINLKKLIPTIILDLKYATKNNFTKQKLYKKANTTYVRLDAAIALLAIQKTLNEQGYGLKVFDAYRPYAVTKLMWNLILDERYVANPKYGSGHNKGISVDLTIVKLSSNTELDMGTDFDNFTELAHHTYTPKFDAAIIFNRTLLKSTMEKFGFKSLETEWWHYAWISVEKYDIVDMSFKQLKCAVL